MYIFIFDEKCIVQAAVIIPTMIATLKSYVGLPSNADSGELVRAIRMHLQEVDCVNRFQNNLDLLYLHPAIHFNSSSLLCFHPLLLHHILSLTSACAIVTY